jgi:hypothetical protein
MYLFCNFTWLGDIDHKILKKKTTNYFSFVSLILLPLLGTQVELNPKT